MYSITRSSQIITNEHLKSPAGFALTTPITDNWKKHMGKKNMEKHEFSYFLHQGSSSSAALAEPSSKTVPRSQARMAAAGRLKRFNDLKCVQGKNGGKKKNPKV